MFLESYSLQNFSRGWVIIIWTGLNIKIGITHILFELCLFWYLAQSKWLLLTLYLPKTTKSPFQFGTNIYRTLTDFQINKIENSIFTTFRTDFIFDGLKSFFMFSSVLSLMQLKKRIFTQKNWSMRGEEHMSKSEEWFLVKILSFCLN